MSFRIRRVLAVVWKDLLDLRKNSTLLYSMLALPAVTVVSPIGVVLAYMRNPEDPNLTYIAKYYKLSTVGVEPVTVVLEKTLSDFFVLFLVMPVFIPILISSHAVAGEKEKRTLEPLLASPITPLELVLGKSVASLVPALVICFISYAVLCIGVDLIALPLGHGPILPNTVWSFGVFCVAPLFAFFGNGVAVLISSRVSDARTAQQMSGLIVLPLVGLAGGQLAGFITSGIGYYAVIGLVVLLFDIALLFAVRRLFDRERLMSRWV